MSITAAQQSRFSNWVCAKCFDSLESAGQFAGMDRYPDRTQPYDCEQCGFHVEKMYSLYIEP